ncbi:MAG: hypothetical protein QM731_19670 [Chitinophagaceae bacterium]
MAKEEVYITDSCVISNKTVYHNGIAVFTGEEPSLPDLLLAAYKHFAIEYPKFYKMDTLSKLGFLATEILLKDGAVQQYAPEEKGIVLTNASASLDTDLKYFATVQEIASPALFVYTLPNIVIGEICIRNNFKGENGFFVFKQFDATFIQQYISNLFASGGLKACIGGWTEVLDDAYKTVLFLVQKEQRGQAIPFSTENINHIYQL